MFGGRVFQQTVGISMGTICAPLLADMLHYSYMVDFIQGLLTKNKKRLARYIDDVLSLNNSRFGDFVDRIYPIELEIKEITDTDNPTYLDLHLEIFSEERLKTTKEMISIFSSWTFHLYVAKCDQHMEYIYFSWYDIAELVVPIWMSLVEGCG